jgi:cytochrome c55X
MSINCRSIGRYAGTLLLISHTASVAAMPAQDPDASAAVRAQVEAGKQLFAASCSNCHGAGGKGAIGPALADRGLAADLIRSTMLNGRVGTPMPPFKDDLDAKSQAQIMAYVLWITSAGRLPDAVVSSEPPAGSAGSATGPSTLPIPIGTERGTPAHGAALFFDATQVRSCRACHSYGNKGGPVGPDLINTDKTPLEIYQRITRPKVAAAGFPAIAVELRDGSRVVGIRGEVTDELIQVFDVSSLPPVKRSILKSDVLKLSGVGDSGIYDHTTLPYSKQDLLDLSAYVGKTDKAPTAR